MPTLFDHESTYESAARYANAGLPDGCLQSDIDSSGASPVAFASLSKSEQRKINLEYIADAGMLPDILELIESDPAMGPDLKRWQKESAGKMVG